MTQIRPAGRNQINTCSPTSSQLYQALWIILGIFGVGMLAAFLYLAPRLATQVLVILGIGLPIVMLLWHAPELGLLGLIFLTFSFIPASIVDVRLPIGGGLDLRDLVLIGLFGIVFLREMTWGTLTVPWWPVGGPLLLFLIMALFSTCYALFFEHVESNWALGDLRILSLYTTFFITLWAIKRPAQLTVVLVGLFIIADLTAGIIYFQQYVGADNPLLQAMLNTRDWRVYEQAGAVRVMPAGQVLMHFMWFVALGFLLRARSSRLQRVFWAVQLVFIGGGHLLTYTRAQWVASLIGLGLIFIIRMPRYKPHLTKGVVIACCALLLLITGNLVGRSLSEAFTIPFVAGVTERFGSLLTPAETAETGSLQWRDFEIEKALQAIGEHPLTGVGLGNRYRPINTYQGEARGWLTRSLATGDISRFTRYIHNSYISIAVKMGIPGLLVLLWFCAAVLLKGIQIYRDLTDSQYQGVVLGILVGFAGSPVWFYYHAHLIKAESTATIGLIVALVGCIAYIHGRGSLPYTILDDSRPLKR
jgi:O-antigen ligase